VFLQVTGGVSVKPAVTVETEVQQLIDLSDVQHQGEVNYKNMSSVVVLLEKLVLDKVHSENEVSKEVGHEGSVSIEVERKEGAFTEGPTEGEVPESGPNEGDTIAEGSTEGSKVEEVQTVGGEVSEVKVVSEGKKDTVISISGEYQLTDDERD